ncbi:MAG: glycine cleavage T C-terminal barrel domain-containing protein [Myxococcota bacterium]
MKVDEMVAGTRHGTGLFDMAHRGLLEVTGADRVRWLDGMISGDVQAIEAAESGSGAGCYALLLTNRGAIVADFHVGRIGDVYFLESLRSEMPRIREVLDRYIIADDVELKDCSDEWLAVGIEGPGSTALIEAVAGPAAAGLEKEGWMRASIADRNVLIAAFGWTGEAAFQLRMAPADRIPVEDALVKAAADAEHELVRGSSAALEILRVEAGIPLLAAELDEEVLPPEARLEGAISTTKGCYIGQEIVARLRARGQVQHLLVGLRLESESELESLPPPETRLSSDGRVTGELTSVVRSPTEGPIALGYVRREHSEIGTAVEFDGGRGTVASLPFQADVP